MGEQSDGEELFFRVEDDMPISGGEKEREEQTHCQGYRVMLLRSDG